MEFIIDDEVLSVIIAHARNRAPIEACGYLGGNENHATVACPMTNADASKEHFSFVPEEQFAMVRKLREKKLKPIAVYHSHPETPARLSREDLRLANDPSLWYVIISLAETAVSVKSFRIKGEKVMEEHLHKVPEE